MNKQLLWDNYHLVEKYYHKFRDNEKYSLIQDSDLEILIDEAWDISIKTYINGKSKFSTFFYYNILWVLNNFIRNRVNQKVMLYSIKDVDTIEELELPCELEECLKELPFTITEIQKDIFRDYINGSKYKDLVSKYNMSYRRIKSNIKKVIEALQEINLQ